MWHNCPNLHRSPFAQADRVCQVGMCATFLRVHFDKPKLVPDPLYQVVQAAELVDELLYLGNAIVGTYLSPSSQLMTTV